MTLIVTGLGTALPCHSIRQDIALEHVLVANRLTGRRAAVEKRLYELSGVTKRHLVLLEEPPADDRIRQSFYRPLNGDGAEWPTTAERMQRYAAETGPLAERAVRAALDEGHAEAQRVTHLVTVSCTGFYAPGIDIELIRRIGLRPDVQRTHVGFMGCHGAVNGVRVASAFASAEPDTCVLVCAVELCSLHFGPAADRDMKVANALFADGAAALVGYGADGLNGAPPRCRIVATGSVLLPNSTEAMGWRIGDHGFQMTLSSEVPQLIEQHLRGWMVEWLARHGRTLHEISSWAIHPGGPAIVDAAAAALRLPETATAESRAVLAECGNMSSPTLLFIVDRIVNRPRALPCVALAFGPGLVAEAMLLE